MFDLLAIIVDRGRRAPVEAAIERAAEHRIVGIGRSGGFLQPLHPHRAVGGGQDVGSVGPVDEEGIADGDRPRRALPAAVVAVADELQRGAATRHPADPAQQQATFGRGDEIGLGGAGRGRQQPVTADISAAGRTAPVGLARRLRTVAANHCQRQQQQGEFVDVLHRRPHWIAAIIVGAGRVRNARSRRKQSRAWRAPT